MEIPKKDIKRLEEIANEIPMHFYPIKRLLAQGKAVKALENALKVIQLQQEYQKIMGYLVYDIDKRNNIISEKYQSIINKIQNLREVKD